MVVTFNRYAAVTVYRYAYRYRFRVPVQSLNKTVVLNPLTFTFGNINGTIPFRYGSSHRSLTINCACAVAQESTEQNRTGRTFLALPTAGRGKMDCVFDGLMVFNPSPVKCHVSAYSGMVVGGDVFLGQQREGEGRLTK